MAQVDITLSVKTTFWFWVLKMAVKMRCKRLVKFIMNRGVIHIKSGSMKRKIKASQIIELNG